MYRHILIFCVVFVCTTLALAQEEDEVNFSALSTHIGSLLPNQIEGVTEIMPMWGLRYAFPYRGKSIIEVGLANSKAEGVTINEGSLAFRGDFPIQDLLMTAYIGANTYLYTPLDQDPVTAFGGFIGGGFLASITKILLFRSEMKFNVNPGTSLHIAFGFELRFFGGDDSAEED